VKRRTLAIGGSFLVLVVLVVAGLFGGGNQSAGPGNVRASIVLGELVVADPDPARTPYDRDLYGRWADVDGDCLSTRHEILVAASRTEPVLSSNGCRAESGEWVDAYTGENVSPGPGEVLWKAQNVWNNDGDTAYLLNPSGQSTSISC